ncbi:hypothetical protein BJ165DRAFT_1523233 [Panaeolus papilionaceus]|nr:hypothetical protein BJ165DRAFT_1523233 [Panaeolus papilionaceus]
MLDQNLFTGMYCAEHLYLYQIIKIRRLFDPKPAPLYRATKPSLLQSPHSKPPSPLTISSTLTRRLPVPDRMWEVLSSWSMRNPMRSIIPRAFEDAPKEKMDLLHTEVYKSSVEKQFLSLSDDLLAAERLLNSCEHDEAALLLSIEHLWPGALTLDSTVALAVAKAARKSLNARKAVCEIQLAQAKLNVQRRIDAVEEVSSTILEAEHQLYAILSAFRLSGWTLLDLPTHSVDASIFPSPPTLSALKSPMPDDHPYLSGSVKSLSARSPGSECMSF